ncbi:MAG: helix-turn-helix domain-containing protein [Caldithrix sp.]|nr:helix-turn-helix domain-containing protein [Caldithrix sp.]
MFKALADANRRNILDIVKIQPGINLQDLCSFFDISRYAVMKHLKVLQEANVVVHQWQGKYKHFYLNAIPIQMIYDRWLSRYTKHLSPRLTKLKYTLEGGNTMKFQEDKQVYVLYIRTTKEKLWKAITSPLYTQKYFFKTKVQSDFQPNSEVSYLMQNADGKESIPVKGKILEAEPYKKLVHTFQHNFGDFEQNKYSNPSRVSYELESMGDLVKLTLIHDEFKGDEETYNSTSGGWPIILNGLKTLLETGEPLPFPENS